jgi:flagellar motor switch protein FliN/FliY
MPSPIPYDKEQDWLQGEWASRFAAGFEAMAGEPLARRPAIQPLVLPADAVTWLQPFDIAEDAAVSISISEAGWRWVGSRILSAAGIAAAADEDSKPTYLEILQQSLSGLASVLSAAAGKEVSCGKGVEMTSVSPGSAVEFLAAGGHSFVCGFSASPSLLNALRPPQPSLPSSAPTPAPSPALEVLYDVELPVSVSFGRAHLPVKEVLKLTSGSIVELNRGIAEPVEVIVNNCVIARGEVVVVEGNYGVRILEIVSRSERLRTLN